jgi:phage terminase small subunit
MTRGRTNANRDRVRLAKPRPPAHLTAAERDIWTRTCRDQTGEWCELVASGAILEMYCVALAHYRLLTAARQTLMARSAAGDDDPAQDIEAKLKATVNLSISIANQATHVAALETKLGITPQTRIRKDARDNAPPAPWLTPEDDGDTA